MRLQHGILAPQRRRTLIGQWRGIFMRAHRRAKQLTIMRIQHVRVAVLGRSEIRVGHRRRGGGRRGRIQQIQMRTQIVRGLIAPRIDGRC